MIASIPPLLGFGLVIAAALVAAWGLLARTRDGRAVFDGLMVCFVRSCLWLRYRIRVTGLAEVARRGTKGILFLPNHPSLIEPVMVAAALYRKFHARPLGDENQIDRFFIRWLAGRIGVLPIPDMAKIGAAGRDRIRAALEEIIAALRRGESIHLYPAGRVYRSRREKIGGNSAVHTILRALPGVRVVLVRTRGLWGSSFSWARGREPNVAAALLRGAGSLLASGVFCAPRREVTIELHEPPDLPRSASRITINRFLERFYNAGAPPNTFVPTTVWTDGPPRRLPEPHEAPLRDGLSVVPPATRRIVTEYLRDLAGVEALGDGDELARDLGLDSLAAADLVVWLESEFGFTPGGVESLRTVGDVMLAACGQGVATEARELKPVRRKWSTEDPPGRLVSVPEGATICEVFLKQAARNPGRIIAADQIRGEKSYRDLITAVYVLKPIVESLAGERVGIMLPAGVTADILYLAVLFAGKTPVMVNWTAGPRNIRHCLDLVECESVLTAKQLLDRLTGQGIDLGGISDRFVLLEALAGGIGLRAKLKAAAKSRLSWRALREAPVSETAAILFTSGSESFPKAVPLSHENILTNLRDVARKFRVYTDDRMMGMLPPFHSFGLIPGIMLPLCMGIKVVHHPNPTEGRMLARLIEAYGATLLLGTPTFLGGILRASSAKQLATLRLAVTGAETCPPRVYEALAVQCPNMVVVEGYGATECSPIVSATDEDDPKPGTIGKPLPSLEHAVVDVDTGRRVGPGRQGMLLVRGPSVFAGYLHYDGESPFVQFEDKRWYRMGDLVSEDADGVLTFRGRLKRFVKLGGEMISLPAIEAVLDPHFGDVSGRGDDEAAEAGPVLAVQAAGAEGEQAELVLFASVEADREGVNRIIRDSGLSPLHHIRRVVRVDEIPTLGTGKTDYRALAARLNDEVEPN